MNTNNPAADSSYNPWPHAVMAFFGVLILALVGVVWMAVHQPNELVSSNYYDQEILYQGRIDATKRTEALGEKVSVAQSGRHVVVMVPADHAQRVVTGSVHFFRPSDARLDRNFKLAVDAAGGRILMSTSWGPGFGKCAWNGWSGWSRFFARRVSCSESARGTSLCCGPHSSWDWPAVCIVRACVDLWCWPRAVPGAGGCPR